MVNIEFNGMSCCGMVELHGIGDGYSPKQVIQAYCYENGGGKKPNAFVIFSAHVGSTGQEAKLSQHDTSYGRKLADYIRRHKLGAVTESKLSPNWRNHPTHLLKVWTWAPDPKTLDPWYKKHPHQDDDDDFGW